MINFKSLRIIDSLEYLNIRFRYDLKNPLKDTALAWYFNFASFFRLCNSPKVCRDLIRLSGVDRLVELCQKPCERNFSDAVLVSCLAVLRRLNANLEHNEELQRILHQLKANDLVRTNLVDSFMEYSTKQESLV